MTFQSKIHTPNAPFSNVKCKFLCFFFIVNHYQSKSMGPQAIWAHKITNIQIRFFFDFGSSAHETTGKNNTDAVKITCCWPSINQHFKTNTQANQFFLWFHYGCCRSNSKYYSECVSLQLFRYFRFGCSIWFPFGCVVLIWYFACFCNNFVIFRWVFFLSHFSLAIFLAISLSLSFWPFIFLSFSFAQSAAVLRTFSFSLSKKPRMNEEKTKRNHVIKTCQNQFCCKNFQLKYEWIG